jgi:vitamin B12 transporter
MLCCTSNVFGQTSVALRGTIVDPQHRLIESATISLFNSVNSERMDQVLSADGQFEFSGIPEGRYLIEASAPGFRRTTWPVDLQPGQSSAAEVLLQIEGVRQSIVVTAEAAPQSTDQVAKAMSVIDRAEIERRNEYSFPETLRSTPGVIIRTLGGPGQSASVRSRGLGPSATSILIDGMRFRDVATTQGDASSFLSSLNIINPERVEVLRGSGSSLYGTNAVGGVVNIVTDQRGAPTHGDLQLEGGNLGLLRGRGSMGGAVLGNRLLYSAGLLHLNVLRGVDNHDRARSTGTQGYTRYRLKDGLFSSARFWGSDDFVQPNASPTATGLPVTNIPDRIIVPAIPLPLAEVEKSLARLPIEVGNATFIPSRDDPDNRRASRWYSSAFKLQHAFGGHLNWQLSYQRVHTNRIFQNGPSGIGTQPVTSNRSQFTGNVDSIDAHAAFHINDADTFSVGYEFEGESYFNADDNRLPGPNRVSTETRVRQTSNAAYFQNQLALLNQKLQISLSGRWQGFELQRPRFVTTGTANNYDTVSLISPPRALTGDVAVSYFAAATGTKIRAHAGNSYRAPALSERFGSGFSFNSTTAQVTFSPFGDPRLAPDRYNSFDAGIDQYFAGDRARVSLTYFYTRTVQTILFDSASTVVRPLTDPFLRTSGYFNAAGGISRGVELSAEMQLLRATLLNASYTYTNANTDQDVQVRGFFRTFAVPAHTLSLTANQQLGKKTEVTVDIYQASTYYNPLTAAGRARAYQYPALTKVDLVVSHIVLSKESKILRWYGKIDNLLNREYYETGFRTSRITWITGMRMNFN